MAAVVGERSRTSPPTARARICRAPLPGAPFVYMNSCAVVAGRATTDIALRSELNGISWTMLSLAVGRAWMPAFIAATTSAPSVGIADAIPTSPPSPRLA